MDRELVISFVNSRLESPDPLESGAGAARWWFTAAPVRPRVIAVAGKPRFGPELAAALRRLRAQVLEAFHGGTGAIEFTGTDSDGPLFQLAAEAAAFLECAGRRLKICAGAACGRSFLDQTKNGSRRWCSLRCMERARAPRRRTIRL